MKKDLINFINTVILNSPFEGCYYHPLGHELFLVFAWDFKEDMLYTKIAYNCDDLQCDYEYDWYQPIDEDGNLIGQEWILDSKCNIEDVYEEIISAYKFVVESGWEKPAKD